MAKVVKLDPWDFDISVLRNATSKMIQAIFQVSRSTVTSWGKELSEIGAKNALGGYDVVKIIAWRCAKKSSSGKDENVPPSDKAELEIKKLQADIEYKNSQIRKVQDNYIERSIYHQHIASMLITLRNFFEKSPSFHKQKFHMIPAETAEKRLFDYGKMAMEEIASAPDKDDA